MLENITRFDMKREPVSQQWYLKPFVWALTLPDVWINKTVIHYHNCEGLKPPYILLGNHNAFFDFKVATKAIFPHGANYVIAIDGFIGREWIVRKVGGICKRKFTNDIQLIFNIKKALRNGQILILYPEARYSLCGTTAVLSDSIGKMCKIMGVPVVTLITHGHHINSPFWNLKKRGVSGAVSYFTQLFTAEQVKSATAEEINDAIRKEFKYDDFAWQKENKVRVKAPWRAEGLHKVLYQCPACKTEYRMGSKGIELFCTECGKRWQMTEWGELYAEDGKTEFPHIPDWYEWERREVRREVEAGKYYLKVECHVDALPNSKKFIHMGDGVLIHDMNGFHLTGTGGVNGDFSISISVTASYSVHIEYEYLGKHGDCVDLNTLEDTCYVYPHGKDFSVTKIALATEELYSYNKETARNKAEGSMM